MFGELFVWVCEVWDTAFPMDPEEEVTTLAVVGPKFSPSVAF